MWSTTRTQGQCAIPQGAVEGNSPPAALADPARLDKDYLAEGQRRRAGMPMTFARLATDAGASLARSGFTRNGSERRASTDLGPAHFEIVFGKWQRNWPSPAASFRTYVPAKGDVVATTDPAAATAAAIVVGIFADPRALARRNPVLDDNDLLKPVDQDAG